MARTLKEIRKEKSHEYYRENRDFHDTDGVDVIEVYNAGFDRGAEELFDKIAAYLNDKYEVPDSYGTHASAVLVANKDRILYGK